MSNSKRQSGSTDISTGRISPKTNPHMGHRARLRARFRATGLDDFEPHQVLELLLTYCIPRVDVNEQAHALIERFGSLSAVLNASTDELCEVAGIGREAALFLTLLPAVFRAYAKDQCPSYDALDSAAKISQYLHTLYVGIQKEQVYLLLFDNAMHLIDCVCMGEGTINSVQVSVRSIAEHALTKHASSAVLAHNHPDGLPIPSGDDITFTDAVSCALDLLGIPLLEHFLLTPTLCTPILRKKRGLLRASPVSGELDEAFWGRFYGESESFPPAFFQGGSRT